MIRWTIAAIVCARLLAAQESPLLLPTGKVVNAGGKWTYKASEKNKLTDAPSGRFYLFANEPITDGTASGTPAIIFECGGSVDHPRWLNAMLTSPVATGEPDHRSHNGMPQQTVLLRADNKVFKHYWDVEAGGLFVNKEATKQLLDSTDARIQFRDSRGHQQVAIFSAGGIDRGMLTKACGMAFK